MLVMLVSNGCTVPLQVAEAQARLEHNKQYIAFLQHQIDLKVAKAARQKATAEEVGCACKTLLMQMKATCVVCWAVWAVRAGLGSGLSGLEGLGSGLCGLPLEASVCGILASALSCVVAAPDLHVQHMSQEQAYPVCITMSFPCRTMHHSAATAI